MLLVKNAKVYAPEYLGVKDILIAGGRIERIADHLPEYEGCEVIDGTGKIVTPGIIDRHVHVTGGGGEGSFHTQAPQVQLSSLIKGGVTTVFFNDTATTEIYTLSLHDALPISPDRCPR